MRAFVIAIVAALFFGCSTTNYTKKQAKLIVIKTPHIRFNDVGYIRYREDEISLELYNAANAIETIRIATLVCVSSGCMTKRAFHTKYFNEAYPEDTLENILREKPIFGGRALERNENGFVQTITTDRVAITYRKDARGVFFKDRRNGIIVKIKKIGQ